MYFALKDRFDIGKDLDEKEGFYTQYLRRTGRLFLYNTLYQTYHQAHYHKGQMYSTGENGEFMNINVNDFRNNILHIKSLLLSNKITLSTAASNTDTDALSQSILGKDVISHYSKKMKLPLIWDKAIEIAELYADCYAVVTWDESLGEPLVQDEFGRKVYEGDPCVRLFTPFTTFIDPINPDSQWHIFHSRVNKYDLAVSYPEKAKEIERILLERNADFEPLRVFGEYSKDTIDMYEFFHKDTPLVPGGRYVKYINDQLILEDRQLDTPFYPVTKFQVTKVEDSPFGYSPSFDAVQLAFALNKVASTIVTNESKFGVQLVLSPKGADLDVTDVVDGAKFVEYDPSAGAPEALNLLATSEHTYNLSSILTQKIDGVFGVSDVIKGQAPKDVKSGSGLALLQSMTVQFNSTLQQNFVIFIEDIGTKLLQLLQMRVKNDRLVEIVGKDKEMYTKTWNGQLLNGLKKVTVELGDPSVDTAVGRREMADNLLQYGEISTDQYFQIRETGQAGTAINRSVSKTMLIQKENDELLEGKMPILSPTDDDIEHARGHICLLDRPEIRMDLNKSKLIMDHAMAHVNSLAQKMQTNPLMLEVFGSTPPQVQIEPEPTGPQMPDMPINPLTGEPSGPQQENI